MIFPSASHKRKLLCVFGNYEVPAFKLINVKDILVSKLRIYN
jgi:hypothetical protein